jgi:hypothetical protein
MTPTDKDKLGFFAQYLPSGCEVEVFGDCKKYKPVVGPILGIDANYDEWNAVRIKTKNGYAPMPVEDCKLRLRSIESLTDEEAKHAFDMYTFTDGGLRFKGTYKSERFGWQIRYVDENEKENEFTLKWIAHKPRVVDYLRSIGILVGYKQYTPEQIIDMGWVTIKD